MNENSPRVCILGATFNTPNMGVSMLAAGAIRCILHRFPKAKIALLDYAREGSHFDFSFDGKPTPIQLINLRFSKKVYLENNIALLLLFALASRLLPASLRTPLLSRNRYMKEILESDLVFALSGGDSFSDIYGISRFIYVGLPQLLILLAGKRLICLPQTIGPFRSPLVRAVAKYILGRCEVIYSRDQTSLDATRRLLNRSDSDDRLRFCYDLAFDVDPVRPQRLEIEGLPKWTSNSPPLVGFNISGLLLAGGYTQKNMFQFQVDYETLVTRMIEFLVEEKSATVLLVPHVFGPSGDLESDPGACEAIFNKLRPKYEGRIGIARGSYRYDEIKYLIGMSDFFVGARMHACIGAISQHIPTVSIAYSDKFAGVMQAIGAGDLVVDPRRMNLEEMIATLGHAYDRRESVRSQLEKRMPVVKGAIRVALKDLPGEHPAAEMSRS